MIHKNLKHNDQKKKKNFYIFAKKKTISKNNKLQIKIKAVIQAELGQFVHVNLFDKDEASDDEILGRWDHVILEMQKVLVL